MAMQPDPIEDRIGDKPAPGRLKVVQAFLNSANPKEGREDLISPTYLRDWLAAFDLLPRTSRVSEDDLRQAISVRDALFRMLEKHDAGEQCREAAEVLNRSVRSAQMSVSFGPEGRAHIQSLAPSVDGALGQIIAIVIAAMTDRTWDHLKICRSDTCAWAFYDRSKNHSGTWCDSTSCGNVAKARAYRARHAHT